MSAPPPTRLILAVAVLSLLVGGGGPAMGQGTARGVGSSRLPNPSQLAAREIDPDLLAAARRLDDHAWSVREEAARHLRVSTCEDVALYAILERVDLTVEQRHRLIQVVWDRLLSTPGAALGIRMDPWANERLGVVVKEVLPGMPAERVLHQGDRITHIDGFVLVNSQSLQNVIQAKRPGQTARLRIVRPQRDLHGVIELDAAGAATLETVEFGVELGSVDDLAEYDATQVVRAPSNNPVRQDIAREVVQRYQPRRGQIEHDPGRRDPDVETHPDIVDLTTHLGLIHDGRLRISRELREYWAATLQNLARIANDPAATAAERDLAARVVERYRTLIPD